MRNLIISFSVKLYINSNLIKTLTNATGKLFCMVQGDLYTEDLGPCDGNCNSKCTSKYVSAQGTCDAATNSCKCLYADTPPTPKKCTSTLGKSCNSKFTSASCNNKCAAKYPGELEGHGGCHGVINPKVDYICICTFNC